MTEEKKGKPSDDGADVRDVRDTGAHTPEAKRSSRPSPLPGVPNFFPPRPPPEAPELVVERKPVALLAEFDSPGRLLHAAEKLRDAGYTKFEAHSPFPVHGMDAAMGLPDSKLGWIVLCGGLTGLTTAVVMIWWMNGVDYPLVIGGKPPFSIPPSVPVMFELTVLFSAFAAFFGMLHLNRLPRHHHPLFESERFRAATDDKFFVSIEVEDPKYHVDRTRALLERCRPAHIELVEEKR